MLRLQGTTDDLRHGSPSSRTSARTPYPSQENGRGATSATLKISIRPDLGWPDLILQSCDMMFFHVHTSRLQSASSNNFNQLLSVGGRSLTKSPIAVSESSATITIVLRTIYNLDMRRHPPEYESIVAAVEAFPKYGLALQDYIKPDDQLFDFLLADAPKNAMQIYCLAAEYDLQELATLVSTYLLDFPLSQLTDDMAGRMGGSYFRRLIVLYIGRMNALKDVLRSPPSTHAADKPCEFAAKGNLERLWMLAIAGLTWNQQPGITGRQLSEILQSLERQIDCLSCRKAWDERVNALVVQWSTVKATI